MGLSVEIASRMHSQWKAGSFTGAVEVPKVTRFQFGIGLGIHGSKRTRADVELIGYLEQ